MDRKATLLHLRGSPPASDTIRTVRGNVLRPMVNWIVPPRDRLWPILLKYSMFGRGSSAGRMKLPDLDNGEFIPLPGDAVAPASPMS